MTHRLLPVLIVLLVGLASARAQVDCPATAFACAVEEAIQAGLQHARNLEAGQGVFGDPAHRFLGVLAFLEKRTGIGWQGNAVGFNGSDLEDQAMLVRVVAALIDHDPALSDPQAVPAVYRTGGNLLALTAFLASGGPDEVGAGVTTSQAIAHGVAALHRHQSAEAPLNPGGWNYGLAEPEGDQSATLFAMLGLAAAEQVIEGANQPLSAAVEFLELIQRDGGGADYHPGMGVSSSLTAANLWCYRLAEVPAGDPRPQASLAWLRQNYTFDRMIGGFTPTSTYHYFWAAEEALTVSTDDGLGGAVYAEAFGDRDPAALGYPEEPNSAYFDFAHTLLQWQDPNGAWGTGFHGSPLGWTGESSHFLALLTLERSLGAVDPDTDGDGLLGFDDNCVEVFNPDQADEDEDGQGDVCDNCPRAVNRQQDDTDGDGLGDACDAYLCIPDGQPDVCDGIDNDCDGRIDQRADGGEVISPLPCDTGLPGPCARGQVDCAAGGVVCTPASAEEVCDQDDNDCDGHIDEGTLNRCGTCGPAPPGSCDPSCTPPCAADEVCRDGQCFAGPDGGGLPSDGAVPPDRGVASDLGGDPGPPGGGAERRLPRDGCTQQAGHNPSIPWVILGLLAIRRRR